MSFISVSILTLGILIVPPDPPPGPAQGDGGGDDPPGEDPILLPGEGGGDDLPCDPDGLLDMLLDMSRCSVDNDDEFNGLNPSLEYPDPPEDLGLIDSSIFNPSLGALFRGLNDSNSFSLSGASPRGRGLSAASCSSPPAAAAFAGNDGDAG